MTRLHSMPLQSNIWIATFVPMSHTPGGTAAEAIARGAGIVIQMSNKAKEPISDTATRRRGGCLEFPGRERPDTM